jgi:hypothetical protein
MKKKGTMGMNAPTAVDREPEMAEVIGWLRC